MRHESVIMPISYDASEDEVSYCVRDAACVAVVRLVEKPSSLHRCGRECARVIATFFDEPQRVVERQQVGERP
jgi:hypothetical protein